MRFVYKKETENFIVVELSPENSEEKKQLEKRFKLGFFGNDYRIVIFREDVLQMVLLAMQ
ncbi:MAG: hypothetical protein Q8N21_03835 [bacterium]|nr:hypothetical protein [bacterium]